MPISSKNYMFTNGQVNENNGCNCDPAVFQFDGVNLGASGIFQLNKDFKTILSSQNKIGGMSNLLPKMPTNGMVIGSPNQVNTPSLGEENPNGLSMNNVIILDGVYGIGANLPIGLMNLWSHPQLLQSNTIFSTENKIGFEYGSKNKLKFEVGGVIDIKNYNLIKPNENLTFIGPKIGLSAEIGKDLNVNIGALHQTNLKSEGSDLGIDESQISLGVQRKNIGLSIDAELLRLYPKDYPILYSPSVNASIDVKF